MEMFNMDLESLEENINNGARILIRQLYYDDFIDSDQYDEIINNYYIMLKKPSFLGNLWNRIFGKDSLDAYKIIIAYLPTNAYEIDDNNNDNIENNKCKLVKLKNIKKEIEKKDPPCEDAPK